MVDERTVVFDDHGIAGTGDLKRVGRVGVESLIYFEVVTTITLMIGLALAFIFEPGVGMNVDPRALDPRAMGAYVENAGKLTGGGFTDFLLKLIPNTAVSAFANGDVLQVLLFSIVLGCALALVGERDTRVAGLIEDLSIVLFKTMGLIIKLPPLGVRHPSDGWEGQVRGHQQSAGLHQFGANAWKPVRWPGG